MAAQRAAAASAGEDSMREIVIDTETTGLDPQSGHRIVEIAAIELFHHVPTGRKFHCYVNPERDMPAEAYAVHGLTTEFLAGHPAFAAVADEFLGVYRRRPARHPQCRIRHRVPQCRAGACRPAGAVVALRRYAVAGAEAVSRRAGEPRRAVPAFRHRSLGARQARRRDRLRPAWPRSMSNCSAGGSRGSISPSSTAADAMHDGDDRRPAGAPAAPARGIARRARGAPRACWRRSPTRCGI